MNKKEKIGFLKTLSVLDTEINIREELLSELNEKLQNKDIDEIERIIFDLLKGLKGNEEFLTEIIKLENMKIDEIVGIINNKITDEPSDLSYINENHVYLIELLIKNGLLNKGHSENYITEFINLIAILNNSQQIYNYWNNPAHQQFKGSLQEILFNNKNIVNLFFLHLLNIYSNDREEDFKRFVSQFQDNLKITIASYIRILPKIQQAKYLLIPISIISIFTDTYNQSVQINGIGQVNISEIFQIIFQDKNLHNNIEESLEVLKELDIIYDFLEKLESIQIDDDFTTLILEIILEQGLYTDKILIDFCILLSNKTPEKYKEIINNKVKENNYWYKDYILENLASNKEILHKEALEFLQFVKDWIMNEEIKEKVKEFLKNNINKIFENDNIFNIYKKFIENKEKFYIGYANELGEVLFNKYKSYNNDNEKLKFIFQNIEFTLSQEAIRTLVNAILDFAIHSLEEINDYQYEAILFLEKYIDIEENRVREIFDNLITKNIENINAWKLLDLLNKKVDLSQNNKDYILKELKKLEKSSQNEDKKKIISQIINNIEENHAT